MNSDKCLHCGGEPHLDQRIAGNHNEYRVRCTKCDIRTRWYSAIRLAVAAWNRRAPSALPEGLRSVIEHNRRV